MAQKELRLRGAADTDGVARPLRTNGNGEQMKRRRPSWPAPLYFIPWMAALACSAPETDGSEAASPEPSPEYAAEIAGLRESLTFHASFDEGSDADFALGDPRIYTAPSWDDWDHAQPGIGNPDVELVPGVGRFGSALNFSQRNTSALFYRAQEHVAYSEDDWSGSISFWLNLTPEEDLAPGYCDPIQITDQAYNDAAVWVDFTNSNPRQFRLGVFGDLEAWNPEALSSDEHPGFDKKLVVVDEPPFRRGEWTHVLITYSGLGSASGGTARLYIDRHLQGVIEGVDEPFTWDLSRAQIRPGVNFVGLFDELSLFDRPLTEAEVVALNQLEGGVAALYE